MLPVYITVATIIALPFFYLLRVEIAWKALVKRRARIEREYYRKVCLGEGAVARANAQNDAMPSFDRMIWSLHCWKYEQFFKGDLNGR